MRRNPREGGHGPGIGFFLMYDQMCQVLYGYILQAEVLFMRYYKVDPF